MDAMRWMAVAFGMVLFFGSGCSNGSEPSQPDASLDGGAPPDDGGPDGPAPGDGGPQECPREALSFACGRSTCSPGSPRCCSDLGSCVADGGTCARDPDAGIVPSPAIECDSADDCAAGEICCSSFNKGNNFYDHFCATSCFRPGYLSQLCRQSCECVDGGTCDTGACR